MSANFRYFDSFYIPPKSPLVKYLGIPSGNYSGKYDFQKQELLLKNNSPNKNEVFSGKITLEELFVIVTMVEGDRGDKFTPEELEIIKNLKRSSRSSGTKLIPNHHIIPVDVCKKSKLVLKAIKLGLFSMNDPINLLPLPVNFHPSAHNTYSKFVEIILDDQWRELVEKEEENDREVIREILIGAIGYFRDAIEEKRKRGAASSINNVFEKWD